MEASRKYFNYIQDEVDIILWHQLERYGEYCRLEGKQSVNGKQTYEYEDRLKEMLKEDGLTND